MTIRIIRYLSFFHINSECPKVRSKHWHVPEAFWWTVFWLCIKTRAEIMLASHLRLSGLGSSIPACSHTQPQTLISLPQGKKNKLVWPRPSAALPTLALSTGLSLWRWRWMEPWTLETLPAHAAFSHICPISWKSTRCFSRMKSQLVQTVAPNTAFQKKLMSSSKVLDSSHQRVRWLLGNHYHLSLLKSTYCTYCQEMLKFIALKSVRHSIQHMQKVENMLFLPITRY